MQTGFKSTFQFTERQQSGYQKQTTWPPTGGVLTIHPCRTQPGQREAAIYSSKPVSTWACRATPPIANATLPDPCIWVVLKELRGILISCTRQFTVLLPLFIRRRQRQRQRRTSDCVPHATVTCTQNLKCLDSQPAPPGPKCTFLSHVPLLNWDADTLAGVE